MEQLNLFPYPIGGDTCYWCGALYEIIAWSCGEPVAWWCMGPSCRVIQKPDRCVDAPISGEYSGPTQEFTTYPPELRKELELWDRTSGDGLDEYE